MNITTIECSINSECAIQTQCLAPWGVWTHELFHHRFHGRIKIFRNRVQSTNHWRHSRFLRFGKPNPEFATDLAHNFFLHKRAEAAMRRIDATNQFACEPAVGQRVIAVLGPDVPTRRSGGQSLGDRGPIERLRQTDISVNGVQPTLV